VNGLANEYVLLRQYTVPINEIIASKTEQCCDLLSTGPRQLHNCCTEDLWHKSPCSFLFCAQACLLCRYAFVLPKQQEDPLCAKDFCT